MKTEDQNEEHSSGTSASQQREAAVQQELQSEQQSAVLDSRLGIAPVKKEYLVTVKGHVINWDHVTENEAHKAQGEGCDQSAQKRPDDRDLFPNKRFKLKGQNKSKMRYKIGKKYSELRGRNADDTGDGDDCGQRARIDKGSRLCLRYMEQEGFCSHANKCVYSHDLYKIYSQGEPNMLESDKPCFIYTAYGRCHFGVACLYAKSHTKVLEEKQRVFNLINHKRWSLCGGREDFIERVMNKLEVTVQQKLRKKKYDLKLVTDSMNALYKADIETNKSGEKDGEEAEENEPRHEEQVSRIGAVFVDEFLQGRDYDRKKVDFKEKLYLAPLTTVGNLPFRRLCKKYLCDITCAEMSLCSSLLNGNPSEWSHIKRHESEDVFGVQITASHPEHTTKIVKVLNDNCQIDFVDFNCGCPTEWVYQTGAGAGLMNRPSKLRKMIAGACMVSKVPITIKMRTGCSDGKNTAHNLINSVVKPFTSKYIGAVTIHGRSRAQRYTKLADWHYVNECGRFTDDIPLLGSGDCISWQDYYEKLEKYKNISGVVIARGALIAPWLFTEIKERRTWDITSRERLDIIKDYANFALDHWGSDATGVENCRRYLLEWLSFACRYIPVGLLEVLPQKINERPPMYRGRDELETLLSSSSASDWVKISEMFLGKVPENFKFLPKHKANAYESIVEG